MSGYDWVPCHNFHIPPNAIKCGHDEDGSDLYVGQAVLQRDELPCKVVPRRKEAYVAYDGKETKVSNFKVLVQQSMVWEKSSDGRVPHGAIPGGKTSTGETLYIGRSSVGRATVVGKVHPSHKCLYVPFAGQEVPHKSYEVLVLK